MVTSNHKRGQFEFILPLKEGAAAHDHISTQVSRLRGLPFFEGNGGVLFVGGPTLLLGDGKEPGEDGQMGMGLHTSSSAS